MIPLRELNRLPGPEFVAALASIFEHSSWVAERVAALRPFDSTIGLHRALCDAVLRAGDERQLSLIRAHPELAGRVAGDGLTAASADEQQGAGLSACTPRHLASLRALNAEYRARFGFPFVLAVKGHSPDSVIAALTERITHDISRETEVALLEIGRIARFRLAALVDEPLGDAVMAMLRDLATFSDDDASLTCAYLTPAHRATAARLKDFMLAAGLRAHIDAVGNVVGVLPGGPAPRRVLTGSHYDTVVDAGRYDGRLGIVLPIAVAGKLHRAGVQLPFTLEIIGFAEEEGVRFNSTFLGSRAVAGRFEEGVLDSLDATGTSMRDALGAAGHEVAAIAGLARDRTRVQCFVEVHIEQGPVLLDAGEPVGVVTAIAGSVRSLVTVRGMPGHAGTVPMPLRRDAAAAAAEMVLAVERRCSAEAGLVGTVGKLGTPAGAMNVIPGRCEFSVDIRSGSDSQRSAANSSLAAEFRQIAARRGVSVEQVRVVEAAGVPCAPALQAAWAASIERVTGRAALRLPSGAGHDAMMMAALADVGMLFVRCGNGGISHHPDEALEPADADVAARVFSDFLQHVGSPACE